MIPRPKSGLMWLATALGLALAGPAHAGSDVEQVFQLKVGWNAIYLEVQPEPRDPDAVFAGVPVEAVWTFASPVVAAQYIQNPSEATFNAPGWLGYFPPDQPEAVTSNLRAIQANRPYLVKLLGPDPVELRISGRPSLRPLRWAADQLTLIGLPVDPTATPTFAQFFAASPAHAGQVIFGLDASGSWVPVDPASETVKSGVSYWISTAGGSTYQGPIELELAFGDGLEFGETLIEGSFGVRVISSAVAEVSLRLMDADVPLLFKQFAPVSREGVVVEEVTYTPIVAGVPLRFPAGVGDRLPLNFAVRRADFASDEVASVLEVRDGAGVRRYVPVSARRVPVGRRAGVPPPATSLAGLWVGHASIDAVSESNPARPDLSFDLELRGTPLAAPAGDPGLVLVPARSNWLFCDAGVDLGLAWIEASYDTASGCDGASVPWSSGTSELGFGDGDDGTPNGAATVLAVGAPLPTPTFYFRKTFDAADPSSFSALRLLLQRDDGAIVYLNGSEVARSNLAAGSEGIAFGAFPTSTVGGEDEQSFVEIAVDPIALQAGSNVLAVAIYQRERAPGDGADAVPTPTASEFRMRLILHVDASGQVRLLDEVIQMWEDGTIGADATIARTGRHVLLTEEERIPSFRGAVLRDGESVGVRVSSAAFDLDAPLSLEGEFAIGSTVKTPDATPLVDPLDGRTNPFRHRFNPDHDNLDAQGGFQAEAFEVTRALSLDFVARDPEAPDPPAADSPEWGWTLMGGIYRETLTGLHKNPISVQGTFRLRRVSLTGELDPEPLSEAN